MKFLILGILLVLIIGCGDRVYVTDNELRQKLFFECLSKIPQGPSTVKYNDWQEVVDECSDCAYSMSTRYVKKDSITSFMLRR